MDKCYPQVATIGSLSGGHIFVIKQLSYFYIATYCYLCLAKILFFIKSKHT